MGQHIPHGFSTEGHGAEIGAHVYNDRSKAACATVARHKCGRGGSGKTRPSQQGRLIRDTRRCCHVPRSEVELTGLPRRPLTYPRCAGSRDRASQPFHQPFLATCKMTVQSSSKDVQAPPSSSISEMIPESSPSRRTTLETAKTSTNTASAKTMRWPRYESETKW